MREKLTVALLATAIVLGVVATRALLIVTKDTHQTAISYQQVATELQRDLHTVTLQATDKNNGLAPILKETHDTVRQTRKLIDVALQTSLEERASMKRASGETVSILSHADLLISHLDSKVDPMADSFLRVSSQSEAALKSSSNAMDAATGILNDPRIPQILDNTQTITKSGAAISADAQYEVHKFVYPPPSPWWMKAYNFSKTAGSVTFDILTLK